MQRIDENTYIDDTLVTCAEYQLFIDEMHLSSEKIGKYVQPHHWVSKQFPEGKAKEPILGVRHIDAEGFCKWLTQSENTGWTFRLPYAKESSEFPIRMSLPRSFGYWCNNPHSFAWVSAVPENPRALIFDHDRVLALARKLHYESYGAGINKIDRFLSTIVSSHYIERAYRRTGALDIIFDVEETLEFNIKRTLRFMYINITDHVIQDLDIEPKWINLFLDQLVDIITLEERIAGRSPAFEGIRLVKERIR